MSDFKQYIKNIGHVDFELQPLNEVDIAVMVEMVYLKLDDYVSHVISESKAISVMDFYQQFAQDKKEIQEENPFLISKGRLEVAKAAAQASRYRNIQIFGFQSDLDLKLEKQFAAATFYIPEVNTYLVVFRGTEDFNMSHQTQVPAQDAAREYLTKVMTEFDGQYIIAGHSKGANLAIYAASQLDKMLQNQVSAIYAYDGPGYQRDFLETEGYLAIESKIHAFQPEDAVVSQILFHTVQAKVVACKGISMMQHLLENWQIDKVSFKEVESVTPGSQRLQATLGQWVDQHSAQELEEFFGAIFGIIEATGIETLNEIGDNFLMFLISLQREIRDTEDSDLLKEGFAQLQAIYKEQGDETNANFLEVVQGKIDSATSFIKNLVPDALLPGKSEDKQVEEEGDPQAKSEEIEHGAI